MAIYPINPNEGIKKGSSIAKIGATTYLEKYDPFTFSSGVFVDPTGYNNRFSSQTQSWGLGTGYQANTTGSRLFTNASGFGLYNTTVINRGPNNAYIAFNITGWDITRAVQLKTDESISVTQTWVENIWAASNTGIVVIDAHGMKDSRPY